MCIEKYSSKVKEAFLNTYKYYFREYMGNNVKKAWSYLSAVAAAEVSNTSSSGLNTKLSPVLVLFHLGFLVDITSMFILVIPKQIWQNLTNKKARANKKHISTLRLVYLWIQQKNGNISVWEHIQCFSKGYPPSFLFFDTYPWLSPSYLHTLPPPFC